MTRKIISSGAAVLAFCLMVIAIPKLNFSGEWIMDRGRSFGMPGNMQQTMKVTHAADQMEVETTLTMPDNERVVKDIYVLDAKERDFTPPAPANAPPPKGKRTATWLPDGKGILLTELITSETPKGPVTTQMVRKWTFTSENELTITTFVDGPNGSYEAKRIFLKK